MAVGVPMAVHGSTSTITQQQSPGGTGTSDRSETIPSPYALPHMDFWRLCVPRGHRFARLTWLCWYPGYLPWFEFAVRPQHATPSNKL